ncbi:MAG: hypothetical protein WC004_01785 [Candidatus Absconditabacterales bacterium]
MYNKKHLHSLLGYLGIGFISGAISHGFFSETRSIIMASIGIGLFLLGELLKEGEKNYISLLVFGLLYSVAVGMVSGGLQHFLDSPLRSLWIIPVGYGVSLLVFPWKEKLMEIKRRQHLLSIIIGLAISVGLYFGIQEAIKRLPAELFLQIGDSKDHGHEGEEKPQEVAKKLDLQRTCTSPRELSIVPLYNDQPLNDLQTINDKYIHLMLVRQDGRGFMHLYPEKNKATGKRVTSITFPSVGLRYLYADLYSKQFGPQVITGSILANGVKEPFTPTPVVTGETVINVSGLDYRIERDTLAVQQDNRFTVIIPTGEAQEYFGAKGHMAIINLSDMSYSRGVVDEQYAGGGVSFTTNFTKPGIYRIFIQMMVNEQVVTLPFTVMTPEKANPAIQLPQEDVLIESHTGDEH